MRRNVGICSDGSSCLSNSNWVCSIWGMVAMCATISISCVNWPIHFRILKSKLDWVRSGRAFMDGGSGPISSCRGGAGSAPPGGSEGHCPYGQWSGFVIASGLHRLS